MQQKPDIFDRIFSIGLLRFTLPVYKKYKEQLLYLFFGGLTTAVSIGSFALFTKAIPCDELIANVISWVIAVLFAFVTNRKWVFQAGQKGTFWSQLWGFSLGRAATLLLEETMLLILVKWLLWDAMLVKLAAQILIVIANYVISKLFVFKK